MGYLGDSELPAEENRSQQKGISRSGFLKRMLGLSGMTLGLPWLANAEPAHSGKWTGSSYLLRGAYIMTMGPAGDIENGNVLIENGKIQRVGSGFSTPPNAKEIEMNGQLIMPGFVDTHTHMWLTQMRGLFQNTKQTAYFPLVEKLGRNYVAEDIYIGMYLGAVESLSAGITFSTPFFDNGRDPAFAEAALNALSDAGIRARFLYAGHDDQSADEPLNRDHIEQLTDHWGRWSNNNLLGLGLGWRGVHRNPENKASKTSIGDYEAARKLGLPISVHARETEGFGSIEGLVRGGFLRPDVQLVHATGVSAEQIEVINSAGSSVALTPVTEQRVGFGITRLQDFENINQLSLGIDGNALGGSANMFEAMRLLALTESAASKNEFSVDPRRILQMATIEGARAMGIDDKVGTIEKGKRADLLAVDLQKINLGRFFQKDPASLIVYSAHPENIDMVMVDGTIKKVDGQLVDVNVDQTLNRARKSIDELQKRAGTDI